MPTTLEELEDLPEEEKVEPLPSISCDLPFSLLDRIVQVPDMSAEDSDSPTGRGYQRTASQDRFEAIGTYFAKGGVTTTLLLSCRDGELREDIVQILSERGEFELRDLINKVIQLVGKGGLKLVDGQHRFGGLRWVYENLNVDRTVPINIVFGMTISEEAKLFNDVNMEAKRMPKAHPMFLDLSFSDNPNLTDSDTRLNRLVMRLIKECHAWKGKVGVKKINRKTGEVITMEGLRRCLALFFPPLTFDLHNDEELYKRANDFYEGLAIAAGENWGSHYLLQNGRRVGLTTKWERSRLHHLATLAGLSSLGYIITQQSEENQKEIFEKLTTISWAEDSPQLTYPAGFTGQKHAKEVFRQILLG